MISHSLKLIFALSVILLQCCAANADGDGESKSKAGYPFPSCSRSPPLLQLPTDPVPLKQILGPWFTIRSVHPPGFPPGVDCQADTYWVNFGDQDKEPPVVNLLYQQRMNGETQYHQAASVNMTYGAGGAGAGLVQRHWTFSMFGMQLPVMFVESDEGHSWSIWHTCAETGGSGGFPVWVLMTRDWAIDSALHWSSSSWSESRSIRGIRVKRFGEWANQIATDKGVDK